MEKDQNGSEADLSFTEGLPFRDRFMIEMVSDIRTDIAVLRNQTIVVSIIAAVGFAGMIVVGYLS